MTQQHKNGDTSPDRVANGDIVERLRTWFRDVNAVSAIDLMDEAANEIERLRQFDRSQPIKPAEDTHATHATPCEGGLQGEGTLPNSYRENDEKRGVSDMKQKPVAWARFFQNGGPQSVYLDRPPADAVPLYSSPTITAEEREAIYRAEARLRTAHVPDDETAATLRKLLKRMP
jgi:hypothetical protein